MNVQVLAMGVDLPACDSVLFSKTPKYKTKDGQNDPSIRAAIQKMGRAGRLFPGKARALVFAFTHRHDPWLRSFVQALL